MSFEAFVDYYENRHVPLALLYLQDALHYQRRYIQPGMLDHQQSVSGGAEPYDCMTEMTFADRAVMEATLGRLAEPEVAAIIVSDEERFLDRSQLLFFIVEDECKLA